MCENDNDSVIGTFFFNQGKEIEPNYIDIEDGNWTDSSTYGVVHRIASEVLRIICGAKLLLLLHIWNSIWKETCDDNKILKFS